MARSLIAITELDSLIEQQLLKYGSLKDFHITLWRHDPDLSGCNWNARVDRIQQHRLAYTGWWQITQNGVHHTLRPYSVLRARSERPARGVEPVHRRRARGRL